MRQLWGIDGGQGSGKTTYAHQLVSDLHAQNAPAVYVETDDFLRERSFRDSLPPAFFENPDNLLELFDFQRMGQTLMTLLDTPDPSFTVDRLYNSETGRPDRSKTYRLTEASVVIAGGPYLLHEDWPPFDRLVFLAAPVEVRLARTLVRNQAKARSDASQRELFANLKILSALLGRPTFSV